MSGAVLASYVRTREFALRTWRMVKRSLTMLGSLGVAVAGAALAYAGATVARLPDAMLLQLTRDNAIPPSISDARTLWLAFFGSGIGLTALGLHLVREWFRSAENKESV